MMYLSKGLNPLTLQSERGDYANITVRNINFTEFIKKPVYR